MCVITTDHTGILEAVLITSVIIASSCRLIRSSSASHGRGRRDRTRDRTRDRARDRTRDRARDRAAPGRRAAQDGAPRLPIVSYQYKPSISLISAQDKVNAALI